MAQVIDPDRIRFSQEARPLVDDEDNRGINCRGCLFFKQKAEVCYAADEAARRMGLRSCDAVDSFGEVVVYVPYREIQRELLENEDGRKK